jgi:hypothetical protein
MAKSAAGRRSREYGEEGAGISPHPRPFSHTPPLTLRQGRGEEGQNPRWSSSPSPYSLISNLCYPAQ